MRDWLHVDDHARALQLVLEKGRPGQTYNIGGACEKTNLEVVHAICEILDELHSTGASYARLITHIQDRAGHDERYALNSERLMLDMGWSPKIIFEQGLRETVKWFLTKPKIPQ